MSVPAVSPCHTCYGEGEVHDDSGPRLCPDCQGNGRIDPGADTMEARLRAIESDQERRELREGGNPEVKWLAFEVRRARRVLEQILAYCDEEGVSPPDALARIRLLAHRVVPPSAPSRSADMLPEDR
jgi:hypothetical protein